MNDSNQEHTATNRSLDKAFEILEFLAHYGIPQSPPAISRKLTDFYCISVPVFASKQKFIAAISIRGSESFVRENKDILLKDILDMGRRMSTGMNYLPLYVSSAEI